MNHMEKSKTIHTNTGTFIVGDDINEDEVDFNSMLESSSDQPESSPEEPSDTLVVNGEVFSGRLTSFVVTENRVTGKKTVKVTLKS